MTPITFTIEELWLLNTFIRHECQSMEAWRFPPADLDLNDQIAAAIVACVDSKLPEYTLLLSQHQLLVIDFYIRREYTGPPVQSGPALGAEILLKTFRARVGDSQVTPVVPDIPYREVHRADTSASENPDSYTCPEAF